MCLFTVVSCGRLQKAARLFSIRSQVTSEEGTLIRKSRELCSAKITPSVGQNRGEVIIGVASNVPDREAITRLCSREGTTLSLYLAGGIDPLIQTNMDFLLRKTLGLQELFESAYDAQNLIAVYERFKNK